ncbi:hypothetical protein N9W34_02450 [Rickettsiales bacterium]|nr:hypothetical protein [Rickettsiales bacterium]
MSRGSGGVILDRSEDRLTHQSESVENTSLLPPSLAMPAPYAPPLGADLDIESLLGRDVDRAMDEVRSSSDIDIEKIEEEIAKRKEEINKKIKEEKLATKNNSKQRVGYLIAAASVLSEIPAEFLEKILPKDSLILQATQLATKTVTTVLNMVIPHFDPYGNVKRDLKDDKSNGSPSSETKSGTEVSDRATLEQHQLNNIVSDTEEERTR